MLRGFGRGFKWDAWAANDIAVLLVLLAAASGAVVWYVCRGRKSLNGQGKSPASCALIAAACAVLAPAVAVLAVLVVGLAALSIALVVVSVVRFVLEMILAAIVIVAAAILLPVFLIGGRHVGRMM